MDFFYAVNAADITPLKTELVDLVSSFLMKEPPFDAVRPDQLPQGQPNTTTLQPQQPVNDGAATVSHMRLLVHLISRQDGEFALKLALHTRRTLHLRSSPNYLVALCAREPNCLPFLQPYMEQIVQLPSDWLSIANFAYFYDCDASHDFSGSLTGSGDVTTMSHRVSEGVAHTRSPTTTTATSAQRAAIPSGAAGRIHKSPSRGSTGDNDGGATASSSRHATPATKQERSRRSKSHTQKLATPAADPTRPYLPAALRTALVHCFAKFTPFSLSKADNEAAEHRAHRQERRRLRKAHERAAEESGSGSNTGDSEGDESADSAENDAAEKAQEGRGGAAAETNAGASSPQQARRRKLTLTYKLLIRLLHITQPAFTVCCLLGKRYPATAQDFARMGLHLTDPSWRPSPQLTLKALPEKKLSKTRRRSTEVAEEAEAAAPSSDDAVGVAAAQPFCVFAPALSGTRMRLPVVQTWETLLSKEGNTGKVWDFLIASRAVAYMALLRNLRNILTRTCSAATHRLVLEKLVDEQQIALSQQLPYRFYSAYLAVREVGEMLPLLSLPLPPPQRAKAAKGRGGARGRGGRGRASGGRGAVSPSAPSEAEERVRLAFASFENPSASRTFLARYLPLYTAGLDAAINTAARINVIPMRGTSVVMLCVTQALLEKMSATGAAAETASTQRKIDVAALLIAMLMRGCEHCVVLLYCYDEYVVFREADVVVASAAGSVRRGVQTAKKGEGSPISSSGGEEKSEDDLPEVESRSSASTVSDKSDTAHAAQQPNHRGLGLMALVDALVSESIHLLARKTRSAAASQPACTPVATSFDMFAKGSGAQFPYAFLDEAMERAMRVESLIVFDEGEHRTYADMNRNAPAFGDLPTYLARLRRTCSPDLVYVGVNLKASAAPPALRPPADAAQKALQRATVRQRYHHHNDLLLTGFSDAMLRLVAERMGGGALSVIERAAETYHVARFSARAGQEALAERAKALKLVSALRGEDKLANDNSSDSNSNRAGQEVVAAATEAATSEASVLPSRRVKPLVLSAVTLPSFDAQGQMVGGGVWEGEVDWDHKARRSERQLQQLTGSSGGLTSRAASTVSSRDDGCDTRSGSGGGYVGGGVSASCTAALPSIRRLFSKQSTVHAETVRTASQAGDTASSSSRPQHRNNSSSSSHGGNHAAAESTEAAWLVPQGKQVSPIYHPQPFISLVKLLSSASTTATSVGATTAASAPPASSSTSVGTAVARSGKSAKGRAGGTTQVPPSSPLHVVRRLITSYRLCRFFISSTFLDMNNERNAITLDVFPRLRRWAAEAGLKVTLLEVDLRWGIPAVATTRNLSTSVCLNEVSRCSPFFLGMIGARYGSCPPTPLHLVVDEDVEVEDYNWMQELSDPHVSVTELEMRHAMYNTRRRLGGSIGSTSTALFFARDSDHLMSTFGPADGAARRVYEGDSATAADSIARLKQRIAASGCAIIPYVAEYTNSVGVTRRGTASDEVACDGRTTASAAGSGGDAAITDAGALLRASSGGVCLSSTRAMLEDDLGRWAVRGGRSLGSVGPTRHTGDASSEKADSLWSFVQAKLSEGAEPKFLTSMDVPLDMSDFSFKVFQALQALIRRVCGVHEDEGEVGAEGVRVPLPATGTSSEGSGEQVAQGSVTGGGAAATFVAAAPAVVASAAGSASLYETLAVAQREYARTLSSLYAAPRGLLEQLSSFAVAGTLDASPATGPPSPTAQGSQQQQQHQRRRSQSPQSAEEISARRVAPDSSSGNSDAAAASAGLPARSNVREQQSTFLSTTRNSSRSRSNYRRYSTHLTHTRSEGAHSILLVEGGDGDGKSSTLAALTERVLLPMQVTLTMAEPRPFIFYSTQAGDDSVRSLLLFLAVSYRVVFHLYAEMSVQESDSVEQLLLALDQAYANIHRRYEMSTSTINGGDDRKTSGGDAGPAALVVLLDGLDKSSESAELLALLGTILHPLAAPHIRFLVSAHPRSPLAAALRTRTPAAHVVLLPLLSEGERAQLVRLHLATYGKLLEESFSADELKELLRKSGAGRPSRLISAITYLRLFSTFATLREDIRSLPASATQLYVKFFGQLQTRFDAATCNLVLKLLLLRHPVGGILEYNLYRLVSNVAVASRLVALLRGICLDSHHGRLFITSTAFVAAVAHTYLPFASDYQSAQERVLVAELRYQPVDMTVDDQEVRQALRRTREAIERTAADPLSPCLFTPERYAPRELLGVLQGSVQASRLDVTATLVCYLPFLECLLLNRRMLSQLIGLLSALMNATKRTSDTATSAVDGGVAFDPVESGTDMGVVDYVSSGTMHGGGGVPLQWRHYRVEVRRIGYVLDFLQTHYHILLRQPSLLRQCVWNALERDSCISPYDLASTARLHLQRGLRGNKIAAAFSPRVEAGGRGATQDASICARRTDTHPSASSASSSVPPPPVDLSALWVHWLNLRQHGGDARLQLTTASPLAIRCMAISPDGAEVALGSDDGFVRRVSAGEEEHEEALSAAAAGPTGGRSRLASTLRHDSAVTAVLYVPQQPRDTAKPFAFPAPTSAAAGAASSTAPQLLVSGCVRGVVYVWNLEDNSLLQRGTGHLRSITGLVCHPLEPSVLCTCGTDTYVLLWNLCATPTRLSEEVQAALALRLPKYPVDSPERRQQQRMLDVGVQRGRGAAALAQSSLAARSTAARPASLTPLNAFHTERQHRTPVACIDFHASGDVMASGSWDGVLVLYNTRELVTPPPVLPCTIPTSQLSKPPSSRWRVRHGQEHRQVSFRAFSFHLGSPVRSLHFSRSLAVTCVVGCHNGAVVVVDYASRAVVARWTSLHTAPITRILIAPNGRCVASADEHGVVRLTHLGISGSVFATLNGHTGAVSGLAFRTQLNSAVDDVLRAAPQQVLLTAGEDRTLQAWRVVRGGGGSGTAVRASSTARRLITSHSTAVTAMATSRDGLRLVTGSADGTAIVFCIAEEEEGGEEGESRQRWTMRSGRAASCYERSAAWLGRGLPHAPAPPCTAAMVPSFVLHHDEGRITCIQFALQETRIVVGVAFGLLYVWSSSPGLNRIEGRLLLRVRVPACGLYPVVSVGVRETAVSSVPSSTRPFTLETSLLLSEVYEAATPRSDRRGSMRHTVSGGTATSGKGTALVTAVCANGDVAVLELLGDTTSHVMAADQNRRRQQQHHARTHSLGASGSSVHSTASLTGEAVAVVEGDADNSLPFAAGNAMTPPPMPPDQLPLETDFVLVPSQKSKTLSAAADGITTATSHLPSGLLATNAAIPRQCFFPPTQQESAIRRRTLDRRAARLQRLLARCQTIEEELRESFQLELHRHRLTWTDGSAAEEIAAVVWLDAACTSPAAAAGGAGVEAVGGCHRRRHLALVVTQRKVLLLVSDGRETVVSAGLTVWVPRETSETAMVLRGEGALAEEGARAVLSSENEVDDVEEEEKDHARRHAVVEGAASTSDAAPAATATHERRHEVSVDMDYLLCEEEYFTSASSAVPIRTTTTTTRSSHVPHAAEQPHQGRLSDSTATNAFAIALTTSRGEVLLLRVQVQPVQKTDHLSPSANIPAASVDGLTGEPTTPPPPPPVRSLEEELAAQILPAAHVQLCQRMNFARAVSTTTTTTSTQDVEADEAAAGPAVAQRTSVAPLATTVQLSVLPRGIVIGHHHTVATTSETNLSVEEVVLVAGCSDGSARLWVMPTTPLATRGHRLAVHAARVDTMTADLPIGCFYCTSAVSMVSPLMQPSTPARSPAQRGAQASARVAVVRPPRWVVGDSLGNVYQLQLEHDAPGGMMVLLSSAPYQENTVASRRSNQHGSDAGVGALVRGAVADRCPWTSALGRLVSMMDQPPSAEVLQEMLAVTPTSAIPSGSVGGVYMGSTSGEEMGWTAAVATAVDGVGGGAAQTPADWLAPVDVSAPVGLELLKRSHCTAASTGPGPRGEESKANIGAVAQPSPHETALASVGGMPEVKWSFLPDLPSTLRASTTTSASSVFENDALERPVVPPSPAPMLVEDAQGRKNVAPGAMPASPPALPSFGMEEHRASAAYVTQRGVTDSEREGALGLDFTTPLGDVLSSYRRCAAVDETARLHAMLGAHLTASAPQMQQGTVPSAPLQQPVAASSLPSARVMKSPPADGAAGASTGVGEDSRAPSSLPSLLSDGGARPSVRFALPPSTPLTTASASERQHADTSMLVAAVDRTAQDVPPRTVKGVKVEDGEEEEEEDFFAMLYQAGPLPATGAPLTALEKRAWLLQQQVVLKEAMRVQRYNREARAALRAYQQRTASAVGLS